MFKTFNSFVKEESKGRDHFREEETDTGILSVVLKVFNSGFESTSYILDSNPLSCTCFTNVFPTCNLSFHLNRVFHKTKLFNFFSFIFISWRLITLQYCSGFCHTLTWISHGFTWIPHPDPPSHLPLHPIPLGLPSAPGPSTCLMHPAWAGDLFHPR